MGAQHISKPEPTEFGAFYQRYVDHVPSDDESAFWVAS